MTNKRLRLSIVAKATAYLAIVFALVIAYVVTIQIMGGDRFYQKRLEDVVTNKAVTITRILDEHSEPHRPAELERFLSVSSADSYFIYAYVVEPDGTLIASAAQSAAPTEAVDDPYVAEARTRGRLISIEDADVVHFAAPILDGENVRAVLRFGLSSTFAHGYSRQLMRDSIIAALLGLGLALPLTALVIRHMLRPIDKLTIAFGRVSARDLDHVVQLRSGDELEVLATAFNNMVAHLKSSLERVQSLAYRDELTGLPNRHTFLVETTQIAGETGSSGAIVLVDLDGFKRFNNTLGESEGDRILKVAAERLQGVVDNAEARGPYPFTQTPTLARLSGDLFALVAPTESPTGAAKAIAHHIAAELANPIVIDGQSLNLTASIGVARFPLDGDAADRVVRNANLALDAAKAAGGACYRFFEPEMTRRAVERVTLENELRAAVTNGEFEVHYQPKVDTRHGGVIGCEALVRWRRKDQLVFPSTFIGVAEESGLIEDIGQFVLEEACRAATRWRDMGLRADVAVNVSAIQFEHPEFAQRVERSLAQSGLEPERLELELTETVAMTDPEKVLQQVRPLRSKGVRFAIDDFGTGHSSLSSLTRLPFDVFKIDQSFVRDVDEDTNARVVIETILAMAQALGCETVAEGVETPAQYAFLRVSGCSYAQGWFFGKPIPEKDFVELLRADQRPGDRSGLAEAG